MINEIGLSGAPPPSKSRFILLCLEMRHLQRHSDAVPPVALAGYPLTFQDKSKRKEEIDIIDIRYCAVGKLDGLSIFACCKLLDLTQLSS